MVMRKHQRYFPVFSADGKLLPAFITVANGPVDPAAVAAGNEAVLRARFEDATFFYKQDLEQQLADFKCVLLLVCCWCSLRQALASSSLSLGAKHHSCAGSTSAGM